MNELNDSNEMTNDKPVIEKLYEPRNDIQIAAKNDILYTYEQGTRNKKKGIRNN